MSRVSDMEEVAGGGCGCIYTEAIQITNHFEVCGKKPFQ